MLEVPLHLSCVGIERQGRVRIERRTISAADGSRPGLGLRGAPVHEIRLGIVAARDPRVATGAAGKWQVAPRVTAGFSRTRNRRRSPQIFPSRGVMSTDEADVVLVPPASGDPCDHLPADNDGPSRVLVAE